MRRMAAALAIAIVALSGLAQAQTPARAAGPGSTPPPNGGNRGFVPVTDEMLWKPSPANWLSWRRTLDSQGFSPLDQIDRTNVGKLKMVVDARHGHRQHGVDAARLRRRDVRAGTGRLHPGDQRQDRRPDLGEPPQAAGRRPRRHQPQHRHLGHDDHRRQRRQPDVRHRRQHRSAGVGNEGARRRPRARRRARARSSPTAR